MKLHLNGFIVTFKKIKRVGAMHIWRQEQKIRIAKLGVVTQNCDLTGWLGWRVKSLRAAWAAYKTSQKNSNSELISFTW